MKYNEESFFIYLTEKKHSKIDSHSRILDELFNISGGNIPTFEIINEFMENVKVTGGGTGLGAIKIAYQALNNYAEYCAEAGDFDFVYAFDAHLRHAFEEPVRKKMGEFKKEIEFIPDGTPINPDFVKKSGLTNVEFVKSFGLLQQIVYDVYEAIENSSPFEWGWGDWKNLTVGGINYNRIIKTLHSLANYNSLNGDVMIINKKAFFGREAGKREKDKSKTTLIKFAEFGFELDEIDEKTDTFKMKCVKNPHVMRVIFALKTQMAKCGNKMDYSKIQDPKTLQMDYRLRDFIRLVGDERGKLALMLHLKITKECNFEAKYHVKCNKKIDSINYTDSISYHRGEHVWDGRMKLHKNPHTLENEFIVEISLVNCSKYMHLVENATENIKQKFRDRAEQECRCCKPNPTSCKYAVIYDFEGEGHKKCHFIKFFPYTVVDIEHLSRLFAAERKEVHKSRKK